MIGSETAPQSRSATMVEARYRSISDGRCLVATHGNRSMSSMSARVCIIFFKLDSRVAAAIRAGSDPDSSRLTSDLLAPDNPINRSRAKGGHVHIRRVGNIEGFAWMTLESSP